MTPRRPFDGAALLSMRRRAKLTQQALADLLDRDRATISRWERTRYALHPMIVRALRDALAGLVTKEACDEG